MALQDESARDVGVEVSGATVDLEHFVAALAEEVVVVILAGDLVAWGLSGDLDHGRETGTGEGVDGAVDGGESEAWDDRLCEVEDLDGAQRAVGVFKGAENGLALASGAHG